MSKLRFLSAMMFLLIGAAGFVACDNDDDDGGPVATQNIIEFLSDNSEYSMLVEAITRANLTSVLNGNGPFTLFAPTNDAFQDFLDSAGTGTIANTPVDVLTEVLSYHVLAGEFPSTNLQTGYGNTLSATTFGDSIFTTVYVNTDTGFNLNGEVNVTKADIDVTNGVIHEVGEVINPPTVATFVTADNSFSTLESALTTTGLTEDYLEVLSGDGPFTVFVPTNQAFQVLLDSDPNWNTVSDIPVEVLESVLRYHIVNSGNVRSTDLETGQVISTLGGGTFTVQLDGNNARLVTANNTANVLFTDIQGTNGVVHVIDTVLLPE